MELSFQSAPLEEGAERFSPEVLFRWNPHFTPSNPYRSILYRLNLFMNAMFAMLNGWEIVAILGVVMIMFGAKKLPELARGLGQGIKEFKKASTEDAGEQPKN